MSKFEISSSLFGKIQSTEDIKAANKKNKKKETVDDIFSKYAKMREKYPPMTDQLEKEYAESLAERQSEHDANQAAKDKNQTSNSQQSRYA